MLILLTGVPAMQIMGRIGGKNEVPLLKDLMAT